MLGMLLHFRLVLFGVLATILVLIQAQDQSGLFINLFIAAFCNIFVVDVILSFSYIYLRIH